MSPAPGQSQAFAAEFELTGSDQDGELILYTPLGSTAAALSWSPQAAVMRANGDVKKFSSLNTLLIGAVGTELPVTALFAWVAGEAKPAYGWSVDLSEYPRGKIKARRLIPTPLTELNLVLTR